ncbi:hypothetical protein GBA52_015362 [Prunus armeniaca]|nr:hypothetical protein GBA52_015362 [Prunus armeniaca]
MIRLFVSTLCETAFDWYARLPAGTINSWADEDEKSTTGQLCATKQAHNDSVDSLDGEPTPEAGVGLKLKTLGELLAIATETEAALKDHEKEKGGRRSEEASLLKQKIKNQWRYKSLDRKKPNAPAQKNENGDEKKQAKKISLKERLSKVGDFDESKVDAIF